MKVAAANGAGLKGVVLLSGPRTRSGAHIDTSLPYRLDRIGTALTSFAVTDIGSITVTVKLASAPPQTRTLHFNPSAMDVTVTSGCRVH